MQIIKYPAREDWTDLLVRPAMDHTTLYGTVREVLDDVRHRGDEALRDYTRQFDQVEVGNLAVSEQEFAEAERSTLAKLHAYNSPEVEYFLGHFVRPFGMSLDRLSLGLK